MNSTLPGFSLEEALLSLPALSITTDVDSFFGPDGIYYNTGQRGESGERAGSLELIYPDGESGFQIDAGFRLHGNSSRSHGFTLKHPIRVLFKSDYGDSKLRYQLFPDSPVDEFDQPEAASTKDSDPSAEEQFDPLAVIDRHGSRIAHVHCKDLRFPVLQNCLQRDSGFLDAVLEGVFTVPGDGDIDFAPVLGALAKKQYSGWLVVEAEQDPAVAHPLTYASKGYATLSSLCDRVGLSHELQGEGIKQ